MLMKMSETDIAFTHLERHGLRRIKEKKERKDQHTLGHGRRYVIRPKHGLEAHLGMLISVALHQRLQAVLLDKAPRAQQIHVNLQPDQPSGAAARGQARRHLLASQRRRGWFPAGRRQRLSLVVVVMAMVVAVLVMMVARVVGDVQVVRLRALLLLLLRWREANER